MFGLPAAETVDRRERPETRERLLTAAAEVFSAKGFRAAAVDDIVARSRTSKGSFYNFFPSKEAIFLALLERVGGTLLGRVERDVDRASGALDRVDAALSAAFAALAEHRALARILIVEAPGLGHGSDRRLFDLHRLLAAFIAKRLEDAAREGSIEVADAELTAYAWLGAINEVVLRWLHTGQPERLGDAVPALRALLLGSIGARR